MKQWIISQIIGFLGFTLLLGSAGILEKSLATEITIKGIATPLLFALVGLLLLLWFGVREEFEL